MDPFNSINSFNQNRAAHNAAELQQQQVEFEPYLDEVAQLDTSAVAGLGAAAQHSAPQEALGWPNELTAEPHGQDPLRGMMGEAILVSSLMPTARDHQAPDPGAVHHFSWSDSYQPAPTELTGSSPLSRHEVLMGEDYTGQLRPAKRQRTLNQLEGDAIGRRLSESGNSVARVLMEGAAPSSSREPTARHHQDLDLGEAVRTFNSQQGDQHAPAALDSSSVPPSQDSRTTRFVVHNDRYTALFVSAAEMRRSTPINPPGTGIRLGSRPGNVPQLSARPANRASSARLGRSMEQAAPSSARAATTSPAAREIYAASFAVPEDFSHGTQPASATMLSKLGRWGLLPDAAQPVKQYDIRGERYFAIMGPGGPNDVRVIHEPRMAPTDTPDARSPSR
ncbi:hypothetical protein [Bradyrhizobium uaiense]|uniref:Uncharacterized protein n=1 Tax=Bradyrhizobium uaiense TaxID=2594946 RepID=A0A6P1BEK0_9BRAD|nr:hypothetical protein [Bradyrhizobium uaiense]NEU96867.1 hypothetical protein [Bradyrhizobium uaiense]